MLKKILILILIVVAVVIFGPVVFQILSKVFGFISKGFNWLYNLWKIIGIEPLIHL